ncbi:MAG: tRNA (guanosine(37)-N1)-methyltransferase TrmD [bacterium]
MRFDILTLFPEMFHGPFDESIIKRAIDKGLLSINFHNIRDFANDKHKTVDDTPYGGGNGMVLKVDVLDRAISAIKAQSAKNKLTSRIILLSPKGNRLNQDKVVNLAQNYDNIILICGHYEEFDERIRQYLVDEDISIGDFVLTGGELPAMLLTDAIARMVPGVLTEGSADDETFMNKDKNGNFLKEYPQYTRPIEYNGWTVPEILSSGDHKKIADWRSEKREII